MQSSHCAIKAEIAYIKKSQRVFFNPIIRFHVHFSLCTIWYIVRYQQKQHNNNVRDWQENF